MPRTAPTYASDNFTLNNLCWSWRHRTRPGAGGAGAGGAGAGAGTVRSIITTPAPTVSTPTIPVLITPVPTAAAVTALSVPTTHTSAPF